MAKGDALNRKSKMTLRQEIATDTFANQTLSNINPSISDDTFLHYGNSIDSIISAYSTDAIYRTNTYDLATE